MKGWLFLVVLMTVLSACSDDDEDIVEGTPAPDIAPIATPCSRWDPGCMTELTTPEPDLSQGQLAEAERIANEDSTLADLLSGASYESRVGPYRAEFGVPGTFVSMEYALADALQIDAELPHIDTGHRGGEDGPTQIALPSPGYVVLTSHHEIEAWSLMVIVLLEEERVVEILPLPFGPNDPMSTGS